MLTALVFRSRRPALTIRGTRHPSRITRMISLEFIYVLMGILTAGIAIVNARDASNPRRLNNAMFWGIYSITFLFGSYLPDLVSGALVIVMVLTASIRGLGQGSPDPTPTSVREASARQWGNRLFIPALTIPAVTLAGTFVFKRIVVNGVPLVDPRQVTQISLGIAILTALAIGMLMLRPPAAAPL